MRFQKQAEIEKRTAESPVRTKIEGDQQASNSTVSIEERVYGFELDMQQAGFDECGKAAALLMHEQLQLVEAFLHFERRRGDEWSVARTRSANPILRSTKLARAFGAAAAALQQPGVHFTDQAQGERERIQPLKAVHDCVYVIRHFSCGCRRSVLQLGHRFRSARDPKGWTGFPRFVRKERLPS